MKRTKTTAKAKAAPLSFEQRELRERMIRLAVEHGGATDEGQAVRAATTYVAFIEGRE